MRSMRFLCLCLLSVAHAGWGEGDVHRLLLKRTGQKPGVLMGKLESALDSAGIAVVAEYHKVMGDSYTPTITSANDFAFHKRFSKHYLNRALDFRISDVPPSKRAALVAAVRKALGSRFLVLWEDAGKSNEHLHVELLD